MAETEGDYGTIHLMEEEMREAGIGVFERKERRRKAEIAPANKAEGAAPANKSTVRSKKA